MKMYGMHLAAMLVLVEKTKQSLILRQMHVAQALFLWVSSFRVIGITDPRVSACESLMTDAK